MPNIDQFNDSVAQNSNPELPDKPQNQNRSVLVILVLLVFIVVSGLTGFQLGKNQTVITTPLVADQVSNSDETELDQSPVVPTSKTEPSNTNLEMTNCKKVYTSKYLVLSFEYDGCDWKIDETLNDLTVDSSFYSLITATSQNTKLRIESSANGMGGGYPDCRKVENIVRVNSDIVRFREQNNQYLYLLKGSDFAIQGFSGENGEKKFQNYFTFMNREAFPDANICYRSGGVNPIQPIKTSDDFKYGLDIRISAVSQNSEELATNGADMIVQSIASYLEK